MLTLRAVEPKRAQSFAKSLVNLEKSTKKTEKNEICFELWQFLQVFDLILNLFLFLFEKNQLFLFIFQVLKVNKILPIFNNQSDSDSETVNSECKRPQTLKFFLRNLGCGVTVIMTFLVISEKFTNGVLGGYNY